MKTLAILAIAAWGVYSLIFEHWRRQIIYPKRPFPVMLMSGVVELSFLGLAIWVIAK